MLSLLCGATQSADADPGRAARLAQSSTSCRCAGGACAGNSRRIRSGRASSAQHSCFEEGFIAVTPGRPRYGSCNPMRWACERGTRMEASERIATIDAIHQEARQQGLYFLHTEDDELRGPRFRVDGKELLAFASCSYLGLEHHPELVAGVIE